MWIGKQKLLYCFFMLGVLMLYGSFISSKTSLLTSLNSILLMFYCENCWFHLWCLVFKNMDLNFKQLMGKITVALKIIMVVVVFFNRKNEKKTADAHGTI